MAENTRNWPELAAGLFDKLTGRNAEITYEFDHLEVDVPSEASGGESSPAAHWEVNGRLKVRTSSSASGRMSKSA